MRIVTSARHGQRQRIAHRVSGRQRRHHRQDGRERQHVAAGDPPLCAFPHQRLRLRQGVAVHQRRAIAGHHPVSQHSATGSWSRSSTRSTTPSCPSCATASAPFTVAISSASNSSATGSEIEAEMTVRARQAGLRTAEVPSLELPRHSGDVAPARHRRRDPRPANRAAPSPHLVFPGTSTKAPATRCRATAGCVGGGDQLDEPPHGQRVHGADRS